MTGALSCIPRPGVWVALAPAGQPCPAHAKDQVRATAMPTHRRQQYLAARALLRGLLAQVGQHAADADVVTTDGGRPAVAGWPQLGVSLSHDGPAVAAAVAWGYHIGVDVQRPPAAVRDRFVARLLGRHAVLLPADPGRRALEVAWIWTVQEACAKAVGTGLAGRPWTIDVPPYHDHGSWGIYRWRALRDHSSIPLSYALGPVTVPEGGTVR